MSNKPIPTKFDEGEDALLRLLARKKGLPVAQVIRRCVRHFGQEVIRRPDWDWVAETANPLTVELIQREAEALEGHANALKADLAGAMDEVARRAAQEKRATSPTRRKP